ncbi:MAG: tRNA pseudouridine(38-40) synthase TruA [Bacteroidota bacterium]
MLITKRYFIELSYDGTGYHGWQIQPNALTVQECLDKALSIYFRQPITSLGCGRTDAGVHATQFFAHFDLSFTSDSTIPGQENLTKSIGGINSLLPYQIAIKSLVEVSPDAHARFDATERTYHYHIHFQKDPFKLHRSWLFKGVLNLDLMNTAANHLLNYVDFSCFSKSNTQTFTNNCRIIEAHFKDVDGNLIFTIKADRFLRNMVRAIVGTLIQIGKEEITLQEFISIVERKDRSNAGQSVPACGLYLVGIKYPYIN